MRTATRTRIRRTLRTALGIALAAFLLAGLAAPAGAAPRDPNRQKAVDAANEYIDWCIASGGDPVVIMDSTGTSLAVACQYPDGHTFLCSFLPPRPCQGLSGSIRVNLGTIKRATNIQAAPMAIRPGTHLAVRSGQLLLVENDAQP